jgi:hypothetical protein
MHACQHYCFEGMGVENPVKPPTQTPIPPQGFLFLDSLKTNTHTAGATMPLRKCDHAIAQV